MTEIVLYANDEVLELVKAPTISSGDVNCVSLNVNFSGEWEGFTKTAVLFNGNFDPSNNYEKLLTNGKCTIPGEVLKDAEPFYIGIKGIKTDATKTTTILKYQVIKGVPTIITEITEDVYQQILAAYANLETIRNEVDADAKQTAADRAEVKKMVDSVAGIDEQVAKVEKLSQQAQESATQAGTSATAAEKAKSQAETAKAGAETAAGKTAEDRTAVNQAKTAVEEAQKAVRADRTAVEEAKQSVEQLGNTIQEATQSGVQAVNQAKQTAVDEITRTGTAHKTAVEGAGTQAAESVENVKASATEAVETAKTEAVQAVQLECTTQTGNVTAEGVKQIKAVQDEGQKVLQSIPEDFQTQMETKLDKQQGVENKGKALVVGEDGNVVVGEVQSSAGDGIAIINTMSGESLIALSDSAERTLERLELGGKTEQVQTTGKNLLDAGAIMDGKGISGSGEVINKSRSCVTDFIFLKPKTYTFSLDNKSKDTQITLYLYNDDKSFNKYLLSNLNETSKIIVEKNMYMIAMFNKEKSVVLNKHVMLEIGSNRTDYEPYTGGKPSPSPEYPQEIKSVGRLNEDTGKYEVEISVSGKNLFNFLTCEEGFLIESGGNIISGTNCVITDFIPCFPNSTYSRSITGFTMIIFYDHDKVKIRHQAIGNKTFVTPEKCRYFRFSANKNQVDYTKIVVNPGEVLMDFEPYREPKFLTITADQPLREIRDLKDEMSENGILRNIKKVVLDGSENWYKYENKAFITMNCYGYKIDDLKRHDYNQTSLCNILKWTRFPQDVESQAAHGGYIYFTVPKEICPDLESFKGWLAKNTPILEYQLKEPVLEELSEQNAIRALRTYYPTTVITADGGELDPDIKVTYTADTKNYIDNKITKKVSSIMSQYQNRTANLLSLMPMETQAAMIENDTNRILESEVTQ